jgi:UPF0042 nucleotide-binding protein
MQDKLQKIAGLYIQWSGREPDSIDVLQQAGSERRYFRIWKEGKSVIGTYGANIKENESFFYFSETFIKKGLPVADILAISEDRMYYLQKDYGTVSLINHLEQEGESAAVYELYKKSLAELARVQALGDRGLDYDKCLTNKVA